MRSNQLNVLNNETLNVIQARHSVRMFTDHPLDQAMVEVILRAATKAPSAHNQQAWRFIVIRGVKKRELANFLNVRANAFPKAAAVLLRMASRTIASAPVVIAVVNTGELIDHGSSLFNMEAGQAYDFFRTMEIQSSAAAVENLMLAATSLGLGTVWLGILYLIKNEVLEMLGEPKGEFMAVVPVGYPAKATKSPEKRPLELSIKYLD